MPGFHSKSFQACVAELFLFILSSKGANDFQPLPQVSTNKQAGQAGIGPTGEIPLDNASNLLEKRGLPWGWHPGKQLPWKAENSFVSTSVGIGPAVRLGGALPSPAVAVSCWGLPSAPPDPAAHLSASRSPKLKEGQNQPSLFGGYCENPRHRAGGEACFWRRKEQLLCPRLGGVFAQKTSLVCAGAPWPHPVLQRWPWCSAGACAGVGSECRSAGLMDAGVSLCTWEGLRQHVLSLRCNSLY